MNTLIDGRADLPPTILDFSGLNYDMCCSDSHAQTGLSEGRGLVKLLVKHLPYQPEAPNSVLRTHEHAGSGGVLSGPQGWGCGRNAGLTHQ